MAHDLIRFRASQGRVRPLHYLFADKLQTVKRHRKPVGQNPACCRLPVAVDNGYIFVRKHEADPDCTMNESGESDRVGNGPHAVRHPAPAIWKWLAAAGEDDCRHGNMQ